MTAACMREVYRFLEIVTSTSVSTSWFFSQLHGFSLDTGVSNNWSMASVYFFGLSSLIPANQLARLSSDTGVSNGWSMRCVSFSVILCGYGPIILIFLFRYGRIGVVFILF